jgi:hypothetical protein
MRGEGGPRHTGILQVEFRTETAASNSNSNSSSSGSSNGVHTGSSTTSKSAVRKGLMRRCLAGAKQQA